MDNYLKSKNDEIAYLKVLFRQMSADGEITLREIGFVRAMMKANDINPSTYEEAEKSFKGGDTSIPEFSSKDAAAQAIMDAVSLSLADLEFAQSEIEELLKMSGEVGLERNDAVRAAMNEYIQKYLSSNAEFSASLAKIVADKEVGSYDSVFTNVDDQKNFVKAMSRVGFADGKRSFDEQMMGKMIGGGAFRIPMEVAFGAMEEFKADPDAKVEFTTDLAKRVAINCIVRMACADGAFSPAEKAEIQKIIKETGANVSDDVLNGIEEKAVARAEAKALKEKAWGVWADR